MSRYFTKLFASITESTIWVAPDQHLRLWVYMMAHADQHGIVEGSIPGIASHARISLADAEAAIQSFLAPDPYSRTKANEGRRIEEIDGGWRLLNYAKFRATRDAEDRREQNREAQQRKRNKKNVSQESQQSQPPPAAVSPSKKQEVEFKNIPPNGGLLTTESKKPVQQEPVGIWDLGIALLGEQGLKTTSARAFVGSLLKSWDEATVEDAFRAATGAADIKKYVRAVLNTKPKKGESARQGLAL